MARAEIFASGSNSGYLDRNSRKAPTEEEAFDEIDSFLTAESTRQHHTRDNQIDLPHTKYRAFELRNGFLTDLQTSLRRLMNHKSRLNHHRFIKPGIIELDLLTYKADKDKILLVPPQANEWIDPATVPFLVKPIGKDLSILFPPAISETDYPGANIFRGYNPNNSPKATRFATYDGTYSYIKLLQQGKKFKKTPFQSFT